MVEHMDDSPPTKKEYGGGVESGGGEIWLDIDDMPHRLDGPAHIAFGGVSRGGHEQWYKHGKSHRIDGPAQQLFGGVEHGGYEEWMVDGLHHRIGGPAVVRKDVQAWYVDGYRHREDGPAVEYGDDRDQWWLEGKRYQTRSHWSAAKIERDCGTIWIHYLRTPRVNEKYTGP